MWSRQQLCRLVYYLLRVRNTVVYLIFPLPISVHEHLYPRVYTTKTWRQAIYFPPSPPPLGHLDSGFYSSPFLLTALKGFEIVIAKIEAQSTTASKHLEL